MAQTSYLFRNTSESVKNVLKSTIYIICPFNPSKFKTIYLEVDFKGVRHRCTSNSGTCYSWRTQWPLDTVSTFGCIDFRRTCLSPYNRLSGFVYIITSSENAVHLYEITTLVFQCQFVKQIFIGILNSWLVFET